MRLEAKDAKKEPSFTLATARSDALESPPRVTHTSTTSMLSDQSLLRFLKDYWDSQSPIG